jgi:hypothetical protein
VIPIQGKKKPSHPDQYDLFSHVYPVSPDLTSVGSPEESYFNEQMFSGSAIGTFVTPSDGTSEDIPVQKRPADPTYPPKQPSKPPKKKRASGFPVAKIVSDDEEGDSTDTELNVPLDYIVIRGKTRSGSWGEGISSTTGFMQRRSHMKSPADNSLPKKIFRSPDVRVSRLVLSEATDGDAVNGPEGPQIPTTTVVPEVIVPRRSARHAPKRKAGTKKDEDSDDPDDSTRDPKRRSSDK